MDIKGLIESLGKQMDTKGKAVQALTAQIEELEEVKACLTGVIAPLVAGNDSAERFVEYHILKRAGEFGSYGIDATLERLENLKTTMERDLSFYEQAISVYNRLDKGIALDYIDPPPGVTTQLECCIFNKDMDHPKSKYQLEKSADYHLVDREFVDENGCPLSFEEGGKVTKPNNSEVGDLICYDGIVHVCVSPGAGDSAGYFIVGLQEHSDPSVYHLCHNTDCETTGGV